MKRIKIKQILYKLFFYSISTSIISILELLSKSINSLRYSKGCSSLLRKIVLEDGLKLTIELEKKLFQAKKEKKLPKIVIPVHFAGQSCDMKRIHSLSKEYGFKIIEDASHAIGGKYQGEFIGKGKYSDITVFSFHPVKIITTAEGGMAITNNQELYNKIISGYEVVYAKRKNRKGETFFKKIISSFCYCNY